MKREVALAANIKQVKIDRKSIVRRIAEYLQRIDLASKKLKR